MDKLVSLEQKVLDFIQKNGAVTLSQIAREFDFSNQRTAGDIIQILENRGKVKVDRERKTLTLVWVKNEEGENHE